MSAQAAFLREPHATRLAGERLHPRVAALVSGEKCRVCEPLLAPWEVAGELLFPVSPSMGGQDSLTREGLATFLTRVQSPLVDVLNVLAEVPTVDIRLVACSTIVSLAFFPGKDEVPGPVFAQDVFWSLFTG